MSYLTNAPRLPLSELHALRMDGELTSFLRFLDAPDEPLDRARRILDRHYDALVLSSWSAAWSLGCGPEPAQHIAAYRNGRVHIPEEAGLVIEQRTLRPADMDELCTTPLRTVSDLLKLRPDTPHILPTVRALMTQYGITTEMVVERLNRNPTPSHKKLMLERLNTLGWG